MGGVCQETDDGFYNVNNPLITSAERKDFGEVADYMKYNQAGQLVYHCSLLDDVDEIREKGFTVAKNDYAKLKFICGSSPSWLQSLWNEIGEKLIYITKVMIIAIGGIIVAIGFMMLKKRHQGSANNQIEVVNAGNLNMSLVIRQQVGEQEKSDKIE